MAPLFDERERTAENIYVHDEELRFLAHRRGIHALAQWASESMGLDPEDGSRYAQRLVDAFVSGAPEEHLVESIQTDLERAGKPALSTTVGTVLAQAIADATQALRGQPDRSTPTAPPADPRTEWERHHPKQSHSWGWGL